VRKSDGDTPAIIAQRVSKNSLVVFAAELSSRSVSFLFLLFLARTLGAEQFGAYSVAVNFVTILAILFDAGFRSLVTREVARYRHEASLFYRNLLTAKAVLALVGYGLIVLASVAVGSSDDFVILVSLVAVQFVFVSLDEFHAGFFNALEIRKYEAALRVTQKLLFAGVGIITLTLSGDLRTFVVGSIVAAGATSAAGLMMMSRHVAVPRFEWDMPFILRQINQSWPFALSSIAIGLYFYMDSVILARISGDQAAGYYNAAYRILEAFMVIPFAIVGSINPLLSRLYLDDREKMKKVYRFSLKIMLSLGLPIAVVGTILSPSIIRLLYGPHYEPSAGALAVLVWAVAIIFLNTVVSTTLNAINRQRTWLFILSAAAVINIMLNLLFIPLYGFMAASVITVLTEGLILLSISSILRAVFGPLHLLPDFLRISLAALLLGVLVYGIGDFSLAVILPAACISYPVFLLLAGAWNSSELQIGLETLPVSLQPNLRKWLRWLSTVPGTRL
jgi:O-antigen/teichoic acid export membrane protein